MTYITKSGDSFDKIAYEQLGSERYVPELIKANPNYVEAFVFDAGIELSLPTIERATTQSTSTPPWKVS